MTSGTLTNKAALNEEEIVHIVKRAARLIKDSICEVQYHISNSPTLEQIGDKDLIQQWVPHILRTFMANLTANILKQTSIGHYIVQGYCFKQLVSPHKKTWLPNLVKDDRQSQSTLICYLTNFVWC